MISAAGTPTEVLQSLFYAVLFLNMFLAAIILAELTLMAIADEETDLLSITIGYSSSSVVGVSADDTIVVLLRTVWNVIHGLQPIVLHLYQLFISRK